MKSRITALYSLATVFLIVAAGMFLPDWESPQIIKFLVLAAVLFLLSIALYRTARKLDFDSTHRVHFRTLLLIALLLRVVMLIGSGSHTWLSDDVYRYVWDGKLNAHGINPYEISPNDPTLIALRDDVIYPEINHIGLPTIYPPMTQVIFTAAYLIGGDSIIAFKVISALFELLTIIGLILWLGMLRVPRANVLLYLFSPLILVEFFVSSHVDILAMPFFMAALMALHDERPGVTGAMLALAGLVKFLGFIAAPLLFFHFRGRKRWIFAGALAATGAILYLPYIAEGGSLFGSLGEFLETWEFSGSVFGLLKLVIEPEHARLICAGLLLGWLAWLIARKGDVMEGVYRSFAGFVILTPVFFAWYFVWIVPFMIRNLSPAFLYLSGAILLSYHYLIAYYDSGTWAEIWWLRLVMYVPFYGLLLWGIRRRQAEG